MKTTRAPTLFGLTGAPPVGQSGCTGGSFDYSAMGRAPLRSNRRDFAFSAAGRSGFTLLEVLLALALLVALLLLLSGGYQTYLAKGKSVKNIGNHRQIISALLAFAQENKGRLPYSYEDPDMSYPRRLCRDGYVTDPSIFYSPLAADWYKKINGWRNANAAATVPWFYTNYAANRYGAMPYGEYQGSKPDGSRKPVNLQQVASEGNLGKLMVLLDIYHKGYAERGGGYVWFNSVAHLPKNEKSYGGTIYASFADGHVEGFSLLEVTSLMQKPDGQPPIFKDIYTKKN